MAHRIQPTPRDREFDIIIAKEVLGWTLRGHLYWQPIVTVPVGGVPYDPSNGPMGYLPSVPNAPKGWVGSRDPWQVYHPRFQNELAWSTIKAPRTEDELWQQFNFGLSTRIECAWVVLEHMVTLDARFYEKVRHVLVLEEHIAAREICIKALEFVRRRRMAERPPNPFEDWWY